MCILSGESKRSAANLSWNLLSVSYKRIFDGSDINEDASVFAISCLLQWRVDQLASCTAVTFRLFILGAQVCDKRFKVEC